jgi:glycosyltransferase involved in cell wall biosynthesis
MTLGVVVPTLNEAVLLPILLASLQRQSKPADQILVVDAGSSDDTVLEAGRGRAAVMTVTNRGRGGQIAAGVALLQEDVVLVAHADMVLPQQALESIHRALAEHTACPGGCLGHAFDRRTSVLRMIEWWDRRRARRGESYGDQAQFFRRQGLQAVGGFPDQPLMEDIELSRRLRLLGTPLYLDVPVTVSARRFRGSAWWKVLWTNWRLRRRYRRHGVTVCGELYRQYYQGTCRPGV